MQINSNLSNGEKQSTNPKTPHMFQKVNEEQENFNDQLDNQVNINMAKIAKSFRSDQNTSGLEIDKSLVVTTNRLIDINLYDSTKSLYDYFEELKTLMNPKIEEVINTDLEEEVLETIVEEEEIFNIDEIIKDSEKAIFNTHDKKSLLKELITDVSNHSEANFTYDDQKFEQNIKEMLSEVNEEHNNEDTILIEAIEPIIDNVQNMKKSKMSVFLILTILTLLIVAAYIYKDFIIDFITK